MLGRHARCCRDTSGPGGPATAFDELARLRAHNEALRDALVANSLSPFMEVRGFQAF